jgi:hypothetical protein
LEEDWIEVEFRKDVFLLGKLQQIVREPTAARERTGLAVCGEPGALEIPLDPNGSPLGMTALIRRPTVCGP